MAATGGGSLAGEAGPGLAAAAAAAVAAAAAAAACPRSTASRRLRWPSSSRATPSSRSPVVRPLVATSMASVSTRPRSSRVTAACSAWPAPRAASILAMSERRPPTAPATERSIRPDRAEASSARFEEGAGAAGAAAATLPPSTTSGSRLPLAAGGEEVAASATLLSSDVCCAIPSGNSASGSSSSAASAFSVVAAMGWRDREAVGGSDAAAARGGGCSGGVAATAALRAARRLDATASRSSSVSLSSCSGTDAGAGAIVALWRWRASNAGLAESLAMPGPGSMRTTRACATRSRPSDSLLAVPAVPGSGWGTGWVELPMARLRVVSRGTEADRACRGGLELMAAAARC